MSLTSRKEKTLDFWWDRTAACNLYLLLNRYTPQHDYYTVRHNYQNPYLAFEQIDKNR